MPRCLLGTAAMANPGHARAEPRGRRNPICHPGVANAVLVAAGAALGAYAAQVAAIPFYGAVKALQIGFDATRLNTLAHDPDITGGDALAESLNAVWRAQIGDELEFLIADLNHVILKTGFSDALGDGTARPWVAGFVRHRRTNERRLLSRELDRADLRHGDDCVHRLHQPPARQRA